MTNKITGGFPMTAQISNLFKINEKEYDLIGSSRDIDFDPREYGLTPVAPHTACWRGYYYVANIKDNKLVVENLHVNNADDDYPEINGVKAVDEKEESSFYAYYNVDLPINYSGKLLLGYGFLRRYYQHMGYQNPHAYQELLMLTFNNGELVLTKDLSDKAAEYRKSIEKDPAGHKKDVSSDLEEYIEKSFSMEIDDYYY
ncbi:MAG: hypothetical protein GX666_02050 [Tissierellia bacterium]|nr:hypothetical protein [Tissierellia bacterium]